MKSVDMKIEWAEGGYRRNARRPALFASSQRAARGIRFLVVALRQGSEKNPPSNSSIVTGRVNSSIEPSLANALHMGV